MPKVSIDGQIESVTVDHVGPQFNIWRVQRQPRVFEVFCNRHGGVSVSFTDEADTLESDLRALRTGALTVQALEERVARKVDPFVQSQAT